MIMAELTDSTAAGNNLPPPQQPPHQIDTRSILCIDLNEIPSPSPSSSFVETLPDFTVDIVRTYHENPAPPPGGPAPLPGGVTSCAVCSKSGAGGLVCDGCERSFHLACAGVRGGRIGAASIGEWVCGECLAGGVKSKRWPLGVKSKQLLDINASPPSDVDGEELHESRKHAMGDKSFAANQFGASVTYSTFNNGSVVGFQRASGAVTRPVRVGFEDILNHTQSMARSFEEVPSQTQGPNELILQALRDFISERHGVLVEGWRVDLRPSMIGSDMYAVYCAPDGKIFDSVYEVANYLGLPSGYNSMESEVRNETSLSSGGPHLSRKRKSSRTPAANGFAEKQGTFVNSNYKDCSSDGLSMEHVNAQGTALKATEIRRKENGHSDPHQFADELPLQFKDFSVLSLGKVDGRPSYYDVNLIFPVGYKSCWHDKITGSLFTCEVLDGGDSGPIFRIKRCSCSEFPIPDGSTILSMHNHCQFVSQTNEGQRETNDSMDLDGDESIQMMLLEPCAPTEDDILSCVVNCSSEAYASEGLRPVAGSIQYNTGYSFSDTMNFCDEIGQILVEERSPFSAWRVISQKLVNACKDICKKNGTFKFYCKHVESEMGLHRWDLRNSENDTHFTSLDKFCGSPGSVSIPDTIYADSDVKDLYELLEKWLEQDRFGLDAEFVQEILEPLLGVQDCLQYERLSSRNNSSSLPTVENGYLVVDRKGQSKYQDEVIQGLYRRPKKARLTEYVKENRCPPPGKPLCSRAPTELIGDIFQVWDLLERFNEILDLKEPLFLEELEKELINPWFNELDFPEKSDRGMGGSSRGGDGDCRLISEACPSGSTGASSYVRCFGASLTKAHSSLLRVLIGELQSKVAALVDPNSEPGEARTRRGRRKDMDSAVPRTKINMLPINELTWPELARRYILAFLSMDGNLESAEITARESGKVFRCLRGDGGLLCGSLPGVVGMEADALLLAEATKKIFGSLSREKDVLILEEEESDANGSSEAQLANDGNIPEWAQVLEPVRKLPTNVGTRIRRCVHAALEKNPPDWARKILEHSVSKAVYKGNASGPTKKAVVALLDGVTDGVQQNPNKGRKKKIFISISDIIMKQCRIVLRRAAALDDSKVFCNLLGRKLTNSSDNDDEGLLGTPAMVARPLDFRTIDLRLASGAYGGSHEAFLEDVRELWSNVRVAFGDQSDLVELLEKLSQNFESLYNEEVVTYVQKFTDYAEVGCINAEMKKEIQAFIASSNEIPKAPWDEGVCKICGIDRDDDSVLLCDTCDAEYHKYCLNPPLARIPEGNWYCPSCIGGKHATQDLTERTQLTGKRRSKKFQGQVNCLYLDALTHLSSVIEEKEYWEYSVGERTLLLKFLCDELLNSSLIRQQLEQCSELSAELNQKLRGLSVEWKNLKIKEDALSTKAAKFGTLSQCTTGEVGLKEGFTSLFSNTSKCLVKPHATTTNPSGLGVFDDSLPSEEIPKEKCRFNSVDKSISVTHSNSDSQNMNSIDGQLKTVPVAVEFQCTDKSPKSFPSSNHMPQEINGYSEGQCVPVEVSQNAVNESEPYHLELNAVKRNISLLQESINSVGSQLLKLPVRRDLLGIDSIGRLYWALATPRGRSRIVVDASAVLQHGRGLSVSKDSGEKLSALQHCKLSEKDNYKMLGLMKGCSSLMSQPLNALANSSPWIVYETDSEIEELLGWLDDYDPKEKELRDSIMLGPKYRSQEFINAHTEGQVEDQGPVCLPRNTAPNSLVTKATSLLEKNYGPFFELDTAEVLKNQNKKARTTNDEKLYRCECLEPIWPSRKHCLYCHKTFLSDVEFEGHNGGKCKAGLLALGRNKDKNGSSKGRKNLKCDTSHEKSRADTETAGTSISRCSSVNSRLTKFSNENPSCPFNFEDTCSKFVTNDSNKELVREIGLIGSDGAPSFVPSVSPFVSDYTRPLTIKDVGVAGGASKASQSQVSQENTDGAGICHDHKSGKSTESLAANRSNKAGNSNKSSLGEERDGKLSICSPASDKGVDGCCVVPLSSLRPLVGKVSHILKQLKINLLDMDAALPKAALRPSKAQLDRRQAWRAFVKSATTIYEMIQAIITLEDMIKTEFLKNDWWYWSSFSAAAKSSTLPSLALRIYSLDSAIMYEKMPNSSLTESSDPPAVAEPKPVITVDADKSKGSRKSNRKRKELDG